jgi:hypothetical protein
MELERVGRGKYSSVVENSGLCLAASGARRGASLHAFGDEPRERFDLLLDACGVEGVKISKRRPIESGLCTKLDFGC